MVVVVAVTAVLVAQPPARGALTPSGPYSTDTELGPFELNLVVVPAAVGRNTIHLYLLDRAGQPANVAAADVAASFPSADIGRSRPEPAHLIAPGHYAVHDFQLALPGDWTLRVGVRLGEFRRYERDISIPIRGALP
jgi:hypothetical protein